MSVEINFYSYLYLYILFLYFKFVRLINLSKTPIRSGIV